MPLAFLLPPFYDGEQPKYMTYGKAASVLAHEIAHAYGPEGRHNLFTVSLSKKQTMRRKSFKNLN